MHNLQSTLFVSGGNFGLFTGMSFLSLMEFFYLIWKLIKRILFKVDKNQRFRHGEVHQKEKKFNLKTFKRRRMRIRAMTHKSKCVEKPHTSTT